MLVLREPWQRTELGNSDGQGTTVYLTLPEVCAGVFETVLDYMYCFYHDPRVKQTLPNLSAESALGALWLAGRLEMPELQEQIVEHLQTAVTVHNAYVYLSVSLQLGMSKVAEAATLLAAEGLRQLQIPPGACNRLPLEALEKLLETAEEGMTEVPLWRKVEERKARNSVLASLLRAYDGSGRLDELAYRCLMWRHSASVCHNAIDAKRVEVTLEDGEDGEIGAEDALFLLDLAIRCVHAYS